MNKNTLKDYLRQIFAEGGDPGAGDPEGGKGGEPGADDKAFKVFRGPREKQAHEAQKVLKGTRAKQVPLVKLDTHRVLQQQRMEL